MRLVLDNGFVPDEPERPAVVVVVDADGSAGERAVAALGDYSYEFDGAFLLSRTDGWAERAIDGRTLTVDVVVYPVVLDALEIDPTPFTERSAEVPDAVRLLRVRAEVDPARYAAAHEATPVFVARGGRSLDETVARYRSGEEWPIVLATPPEES